MRSLPILSGAMRLSRRPLLRPGLLLLPLTRTQVSTLATVTGIDGVTRNVAVDVPRYSGSAQRLLIEGQRTNELTAPNNFLAGWAQIFGGTGAVAPVVTANAGIAPDGTATATRLQANAGSSGFSGLSISSTGAAARAVWARSLTGGNLTLQIGTSSTTPVNQRVVTPTWQRIIAPLTGDPIHRVLAVSSIAGNSQTVDMLIWGASSEPGATFPSSLILPLSPPNISVRGADLIRPTLASLVIPPGGDCTLVFDLVIPQAAPIGAAQTVLVVDDGTADNRLALQNPGGGATIVPSRITGGSGASGSSAGTFTPGTPFRVAASIRAGRIAASVAGGAVVAATGGPTSGLTHMRICNDLVGTAALFGELGSIDLLPAVPDGVLRALSAGAL